MRTRHHILLWLIVSTFGLALPPTAAAQTLPPAQQEEVFGVEKRMQATREAIGAARRAHAGSAAAAAEDPIVRERLADLWRYGRENRTTPAGVLATAETLHFLVHLDRFGEVAEKADSLGPGEPAWERVVEVLLEAATLSKDFAYLTRKAESLLSTEKEPALRAQLWYALGRSHVRGGRPDEAASAFEQSGQAAPGSKYAELAAGDLHELRNLAPGKPAPAFRAPALGGGGDVSLASLKGKVILLDFWASW